MAISTRQRNVLLLFLLLQNSSLSVVVKAVSKDYIKSTVIFLNEAVKLVTCLIILFYRNEYANQDFEKLMYSRESLLYLVPTICYFVQNHLVFLALNYIDAGLYQLLSNGKIITTAIFAVLLLNRKLHKLQWMALVLLTVGAIIAERSSEETAANPKSHLTTHNNIHIGVILMVGLVSLSGFAGIFTEKMLKNSATTSSVILKNTVLYFWGTLFNGILLVVTDG